LAGGAGDDGVLGAAQNQFDQPQQIGIVIDNKDFLSGHDGWPLERWVRIKFTTSFLKRKVIARVSAAVINETGPDSRPD
ncbi:MAG TPA: hypothetical protein VFF59_04955, partial [Anaerolineae bacterium]|nr:hypothetical protein [Anaerolineae bacterium]